jgi:hypothetical protein
MKKNMLSIFAAGIAIAFSAYTAAPRQTDSLWELTNGANPSVATNYYKVLSSSCGTGTVYICYIVAPETSINGISRPNLGALRTQDGVTQTIGSWIDRALQTDTPNNFAKLKP